MIYILKIYRTNSISIKPKYKKKRDDAQNFYDGREMIINAFKNEIFPTVILTEYPQYSSEEDMGEDIGENTSSKSKSSNSSTNELEKLLIDSEKK